MKALREAARSKMQGFCRMCRVCDGRACAGQVPGMGGALSGASFYANHRSLADLRLNMRIVHDCERPDTSFEFFGRRFVTPIMNGPMSGASNNCGPIDELEFQLALLKGTCSAGSLPWIGDGCNEEGYATSCAALRAAGGGAAICKPHHDIGKIRARFEQAREHGAWVYGMDLDGYGLAGLRRINYPVGPMTAEQIARARALVPDAPFVIKGIMTPEDAVHCMDAGVSGIVVSNHGGRVLDCLPGAAEVLPAIKKAVGNEMTVLADGGIRSGVDALKMLALGADGVLIGRPLCWGVFGDGEQGAKTVVDIYTDQLQQAMAMTGCPSLSAIHHGVLYRG